MRRQRCPCGVDEETRVCTSPLKRMRAILSAIIWQPGANLPWGPAITAPFTLRSAPAKGPPPHRAIFVGSESGRIVQRRLDGLQARRELLGGRPLICSLEALETVDVELYKFLFRSVASPQINLLALTCSVGVARRRRGRRRQLRLLCHHVGARHARALVDDNSRRPPARRDLGPDRLLRAETRRRPRGAATLGSGIWLTSCFRKASGGCVAIAAQGFAVAGDGVLWAGFAVMPHMLIPSSNPSIILFFIVVPLIGVDIRNLSMIQ